MTAVQGPVPDAARMAEFYAGLSWTSLPAATVHRAKLHLLDTVGVAIAGASSPEARRARAAIADLGGSGTSAVWGTDVATSATDAALANGVAAHALELDDTDGCDHSGAVVVPAVLALPRLSGEQVLAAMVVGYDVARRVMDAAGGYSAVNSRGWHSTGVCGVFGAAAAAGVAGGLDAEQLAHALGLSGSLAGGLWAFIDDGAMSKKLHAGVAAQNGVLAAALAGRGFTGPQRVFEAAWGGFFTTYGATSADRDELTRDLGRRWALDIASVKLHASCRDTHSLVDAVLAVRAELPVEDVLRIDIGLPPYLVPMCGSSAPLNRADAQMSAPYAVTAALLHGAVGVEQFSDAARDDDRVGTLLRSTTVRGDSALRTSSEATIEVSLRDGTRHRLAVCAPVGSPGHRVDDTVIVEKFLALAEPSLGRRAERVVHQVLALETLDDVGDVVSAWRVPGPRQ